MCACLRACVIHSATKGRNAIPICQCGNSGICINNCSGTAFHHIGAYRTRHAYSPASPCNNNTIHFGIIGCLYIYTVTGKDICPSSDTCLGHIIGSNNPGRTCYPDQPTINGYRNLDHICLGLGADIHIPARAYIGIIINVGFGFLFQDHHITSDTYTNNCTPARTRERHQFCITCCLHRNALASRL